ncbi:glycosyltransferase family 2 protein [Flavobacterium psychrophilum]|uniref:glycosyltransferase n=1 Tax=Flavobacterium psychrophilum TaxID=96345 RepID=UPI0004F86534|nr:glycosyltransferase family 2 protein [Flavobacterium psychrophilum]AIN73465.1 glycosyl transferase family 2 [Flavobacterium psychrophilum FPG3]EKT2069379.1 glycosyltransferase family 2 protein [Flavobacterium psychrophilum]EKT2071643.1 glycosyltransferase family 2 protein [Flavobacterium psychrophilum]EKT4491164.1 glycosyltransferase family 2 protein [Flavobacterium psychrophilum]ELV7524843.1 glycosyltransferase family 2 protein [Flavobacterium psychrophilum]
MRVNSSIVLYDNSTEEITKAICCVLSTQQDVKLYLIDNSPTNRLNVLQNIDSRIVYVFNNANIGFGAAHNIALKESIKDQVQFHVIVNPDIYYTEDVISNMLNFAEKDENIGMMMPQVLNFDGTVQNLPKLLPSPFSVLFRKIKFPKKIYANFIDRYELRFVLKNTIYNPPILSGCFTLLNIDAVKKVGMYDDKFFMYFEDWDLSRRIHQEYKTIYFPLTSVYHGYESGANRSARLFKVYLKSAFMFFNKWGWFFDSERIKINRKVLKSLQDQK